MTDRKFYKTVVKIEILSDEEVPDSMSLDFIQDQITNGCWSGIINHSLSKILNGKQAAKALINQGSDPEFFMIDEKGNDIDG